MRGGLVPAALEELVFEAVGEGTLQLELGVVLKDLAVVACKQRQKARGQNKEMYLIFGLVVAFESWRGDGAATDELDGGVVGLLELRESGAWELWSKSSTLRCSSKCASRALM